MKQFLINEVVSEKLREFIKQRFQSTRGRFKELESKSGVSASKWKNFYYKKQDATQELLQFWSDNYTDLIYPSGVDRYIDVLPASVEVSERLRELVTQRFQSRGRFNKLESVSGIGATKWKNFFYRKQEASQELLRYWCINFPDSENWLLTGVTSSDINGYPFGAPAPTLNGLVKLSVADRLIWAITEFASPQGTELFEYLATRSRGTVTSTEWSSMIQKTSEPTLKMVGFICELRPYFTEWIITGHTSRMPQVDPTDSLSIKKWNENKLKMLTA